MPIFIKGGGGGEQKTPTIAVSSSGLITATAGDKTATKQLTTQAAKTITPGASSQTAVSSGRYTTGAVTVEGDADLVAKNIKSGVSIFGVSGSLIEQKCLFTDGSTFGLIGVTDSRIAFKLTVSVSEIKAFLAEIVMQIGSEIVTYLVHYDPSYSTTNARVYIDIGSGSAVVTATMAFSDSNNVLSFTGSLGAFSWNEDYGDTVQRSCGILVYN